MLPMSAVAQVPQPMVCVALRTLVHAVSPTLRMVDATLIGAKTYLYALRRVEVVAGTPVYLAQELL